MQKRCMWLSLLVIVLMVFGCSIKNKQGVEKGESRCG